MTKIQSGKDVKVQKANITFNPWLLFVGIIIVATGIGLMLGRVEIGSMIGVGLGFIVVALIKWRAC